MTSANSANSSKSSVCSSFRIRFGTGSRSTAPSIKFAEFIPAYAEFEKGRLALYRDAAKEAEDIFDRWADKFDDLDKDYEPGEFFLD